MRRRFLKQMLAGMLTPGAFLGLERPAAAGGLCCLKCGCSDGCRKVARLVCEDKKVTTVCWGCECEDFTLPYPSHRGCQHCNTVCAECRPGSNVQGKPKRLVWSDWSPGKGAEIYTKKKLMKKVVTQSTPSFKWVVEELCPACEAACPPVEPPPGTVLPSPPPVR